MHQVSLPVIIFIIISLSCCGVGNVEAATTTTTTPSFRSATFDNLTYEFWDSSSMTYSEAETHCASRGKGLVVIYSAAVNNFVFGQINTSSTHHRRLGAFTSDPSSRNFNWTSINRTVGSLFYSNWSPGSPTGYSGGSVVMQSNSGKWQTVSAEGNWFSVICQTVPSSSKMDQAAHQNRVALYGEDDVGSGGLALGTIIGIVIGVISLIAIIVIFCICRENANPLSSSASASPPVLVLPSVQQQQQQQQQQNDGGNQQVVHCQVVSPTATAGVSGYDHHHQDSLQQEGHDGKEME